MVCLYQGKWSIFLQLCHGRNISPCKITVQLIAEFLFLLLEFKLTVSTIKGYRSALNHVFTLSGTDLPQTGLLARYSVALKNSVNIGRLNN